MTQALRQRLRQSLIARYGQLRQRLERKIGCREDADDALQETWIRLESLADGAVIKNDSAYLLRMATNIAIDTYKRKSALLDSTDLEELAHLADPAHNTVSQVMARLELQRVFDLLQDMPERQRDMLMASRVEGLSYVQIGQLYGVSSTIVGKEIHRALRYLEERLQIPVPETASSRPSRRSQDT